MTSLLAFLTMILAVSGRDMEGSGELGGPSHCDFVAALDGLVQTADEFVDKVVGYLGQAQTQTRKLAKSFSLRSALRNKYCISQKAWKIL